MIADEITIKYDEHLRTVSRGGLICPSSPLRKIAFQAFGIIDSTTQVIHNLTLNVAVRSVPGEVLSDFQTDRISFTCMQHEQWDKKFTICTMVNMFYDDKQNQVNDSVRKKTSN